MRPGRPGIGPSRPGRAAPCPGSAAPVAGFAVARPGSARPAPDSAGALRKWRQRSRKRPNRFRSRPRPSRNRLFFRAPCPPGLSVFPDFSRLRQGGCASPIAPPEGATLGVVPPLLLPFSRSVDQRRAARFCPSARAPARWPLRSLRPYPTLRLSFVNTRWTISRRGNAKAPARAGALWAQTRFDHDCGVRVGRRRPARDGASAGNLAWGSH